MAFWNRWLKKREDIVTETMIGTESLYSDRKLVLKWVKNINDSISSLQLDMYKIPKLTVSEFNENFEDKSEEVMKKLDRLPERIILPIKEVINLSKQEILAELIRIGAHHDAHDSISAHREASVKPIQDISKELTGKQKKLLALLLDSGFLSYSEIGEKLGITHESAKNFVNRLLKNRVKARLFSKQETNDGIKVGLSDEIQDEILKKKYRTTANDSL